MKYIREGRMGTQKTCKTGAVVGTYPKPMLVLLYDEGGLDVIPAKDKPLNKDLMQFDVVAEDIVTIKPRDFLTWANKPPTEQPRVLCVDFNDVNTKQATLDFKPIATSEVQQNTIDVVNKLATMSAAGPLPWRTVVLDPVTRLQDAIISHIAAYNSDALKNAMQWAPMVGSKVYQILGVLTSLNAHVVVLFHSAQEKDEKTQMIQENAVVYGSKSRVAVGALFSQWFYAAKQGNKPVIWTQDQGFVKGVGGRTSAGLPAVCGADFTSIYGKDGLS